MSTTGPALRSPLLHPLALLALAVLVVNDHVLKAAWPGLVTGKLSDLAALLLVPPLVVEVARLVRPGPLLAHERRGVATLAAAGIAAIFVAVKLDPIANEAYAVVLGLLQWPGVIVGGLLAGGAIPGPGRAPTVLDPGDLVALPAAVAGWWIASGRALERGAGIRGPRARSLGAAGRVAALGATLFALAATSYAGPTQITDVAQDEVIVSPGDPVVHRRIVVAVVHRLSTPSSTGPATPIETAFQARPRWPFVDPPARFTLARVRADGSLEPATGASLSLPPDACPTECRIELDVAIEWPDSAGRPRSSIAWDLAATILVRSGTISGSVDVSEAGLNRPGGAANAWWMAALAVVPLLAIRIGGRHRRAVADERRGVRTLGDAAGLVSAGLLAGLLVLIPLVLPRGAIEPAAVGVERGLLAVCWFLAGALVVGLVVWWQGAGDGLAIVLVGATLVGLVLGARLIAAASTTFAERGLQIAVVGVILAGIAIVVASARPDRSWAPDQAPPGMDRIAVAGLLVALVIGLIPVAFVAAALLAVAIAIWWWTGRGHLLGVATFLIGGLFAAMLLMQGPVMFGFTRWTPIETATLYVGGITCLIGLFAAFGSFALHPERPWGPGRPPKPPALPETTAAEPPVGAAAPPPAEPPAV